MIFYSFILPAYKADFLDSSIRSILSQTYKNFELVIVDDASPYNLNEIVDKYTIDTRIRYVVNENNIGGSDLVAQWNHCISFARGEYIILASDDDIYESTYLERMDEIVHKYPEVNVLRPRVQEIDEFGNIKSHDGHIKEYMTQLEFSYRWLRCEVKRYIPEYVFKATALKSIGGFINFPLAWFSDDATVIKLSNQGIACLDEVLFSFRNSGINISSSLNDIRHLREKLLATDDFYRWLSREIELMEARTKDDMDFYKNIKSQYNFRKIDHMAWLICNSNFKAFLLAPIMLLKMSSLSCKEIVRVLYQVSKLQLAG